MTLSSHLCLGLHGGLLPGGQLSWRCLMSLVLDARTTWLVHSSLLSLAKLERYGWFVMALTSSSDLHFHLPEFRSWTGPHIFLRTLFSELISLFWLCSLIVHDSQPYITTGLIKVLYNFFLFFVIELAFGVVHSDLPNLYHPHVFEILFPGLFWHPTSL